MSKKLFLLIIFLLSNFSISLGLDINSQDMFERNFIEIEEHYNDGEKLICEEIYFVQTEDGSITKERISSKIRKLFVLSNDVLIVPFDELPIFKKHDIEWRGKDRIAYSSTSENGLITSIVYHTTTKTLVRFISAISVYQEGHYNCYKSDEYKF